MPPYGGSLIIYTKETEKLPTIFVNPPYIPRTKSVHFW